MIPSLIAMLSGRFKVPEWIVETALAAVLVLGAYLGLLWAHHHVYHQGELAADARAAVRERANSERERAARDKIDAQIMTVQKALNAANDAVATLQGELDHEKTVSSDYQRRLAAGEQRLSVLVRQRPTDPAHPAPDGETAGGLGSQPSYTAELDPAVAAGLVGLTSEGDVAIIRLNACILRFDALKAAVDSMP